MKPRLLISDVDGTLLPFGAHELSPEIIAFVKKWNPRNIRMTLATGKPFARILPIVQTLAITTPVICANGALIKDPLTHATLLCHPLPQDLAEAVLRMGEDPRYQCYFELGDTLYYLENQAIPPHAWRHARPGWQPPIPYRHDAPLIETLHDLPHKIAISVAPQDLDTLEEQLRVRFGARANIFSPKPDIVDVTSVEVDKGTAALWLADYLHMDPVDLIAMGDELNDLSLFQAVGTSIAMPDAPDALKAVATHTLEAHATLPDELGRILEL